MNVNNNGTTSPLGRSILHPPTITAPGDLALPIAQIEDHPGTAFWDLDLDPHALITGAAGCGKSVALALIGAEATRRGIATFHLDPKGPPRSSTTLPDPQRIASTEAEIVEVIEHLHDLMKQRYSQLKQGDLESSDLAPVVVLVDELVTVLGRNWSISAERLSSLITLGRSAQIHLCVVAQRPGDVPAQTRDSIRFRLTLGKSTRADAIQMWGDAHTGTELSAHGPGRGTITTPEGPREAQMYRLPDPTA